MVDLAPAHQRMLVALAGAAIVALAIYAMGVDQGVLTSTGMGLMASYVAFGVAWRDRRDLLAASLPGVVTALALAVATSTSLGEKVLFSGLALGLGALACLAFRGRRGPPDGRRQAWSLFLPLAAIPCFTVAGTYLTNFSSLVPNTLDSLAAACDLGFGTMPSGLFLTLLAKSRVLNVLSRTVYDAAYLVLVAVFCLQLARRERPVIDFLRVVLAASLAASVAYYFFPVVGPMFLVSKPTPEALHRLGTLPLVPLNFELVAQRNCVPSMHFGWAILLVWHVRPYGKVIRGVALAYAVLTVFATLGFGYHYLVDLVASPAFVLFFQALFARPAGDSRVRSIALGASALLYVGWLFFLRWGPVLGLPPPWAMWLLAAAVTAIPLVLESRLYAACARRLAAPEPAAAVPVEVPSQEPMVRWIAALFLVSGFAALMYEVVLGKMLAGTFGTTSRANVTVVATYMGGLAIGSWLGGIVGARTRRPLRLYALLEGGVALACLLLPSATGWLRAAYVALATGRAPSDPMLVVYQVVLGSLLLVVPTILMGMTLPILFRRVSHGGRETGRSVALLYGVNTLGAAFGALAAGYVVIPALGLTDATRAAVACDLLIALVGLRLDGKDTVVLGAAGAGAAPAAAPGPARSFTGTRLVGLFALLTIGFACTALEAGSMHLLAVVAGNSVYAFALMLFAFLVGLGAGGALSGRFLRGVSGAPDLVAALSFGLAFAVLAAASLWNEIPAFFAAYARFPQPYVVRELIRFVVCLGLMVPPTLFIGAMYPLAMECATGAAATPRALGRAAALNTCGNILGALVGGIVLLDLLGGLKLQFLVAALACAVGAVALSVSRERVRLVALAAAVAAAFALAPSELDYTRLSTGANVYFAPQWRGVAIDQAESADGGLTTVTRQWVGGRSVHTLLTNGKFQGNDAGEVEAQYSFGTLPLLHTPHRGKALVIGLGTGASARVVHAAGFERLEVAELSKDIVDLAARHFGHVNGAVLSQPGVRLHVTDGRNLLLLSREEYDLVSMEISSIWFAGAAMLYGQEYYRLVKERLAPHGVLQQWVQLHHITREALATVLVTFQREFPESRLYLSGSQGILVGCKSACPVLPGNEERILAEPRLVELLPAGTLGELRGRLLLDPAAMARLVEMAAAEGFTPDELTSTDDNLLLEYKTPQGNALPAEKSIAENVAFLTRVASGAAPAPGERGLATGADPGAGPMPPRRDGLAPPTVLAPP